MISGINHLTFSVRSLGRSLDFYTRVLGLRPVARWNGGAYLLAGDLWVTLIVEESRDEVSAGYTHTAFSVSPEDFRALAERIRESGARIWQENPTEGESLYFTDPDGHRLEIHASGLGARLVADRRDPPEGMEFYI